MKNFLFLLLAACAFFSCEDIQTNDVALQAKVDGRFYKAADARASLNQDGSLAIQGITSDESLTLQLSRLDEGEFIIAEGRPNYALFEDRGGSIYTTRPDGEGTVIISEVNETNKTISGIFNFYAFLPGVDTIYVSKGILHNVPYSGGSVEDPTNAGTFSAVVDGNPFIPIIVSARSSSNSIIINGGTANATILLSVPPSVEPGEYTLPQGGFLAKYQPASGPESTAGGMIKILAHNSTERTIKGSFSFYTDQSEITEGLFEVVY